jgi:hypothetical protein
MARVTIRQSRPELASTFVAACPTAPKIIDGYGRKAVVELRGRIWSVSRFVYRGIRPRPLVSKSGQAWRHEVDPKGLGLILSNAATNTRGVPYARYVHLAGRPRSDLLTFEVGAYIDQTLSPEILAALGREIRRHHAARRRAVKVTRG